MDRWMESLKALALKGLEKIFLFEDGNPRIIPCAVVIGGLMLGTMAICEAVNYVPPTLEQVAHARAINEALATNPIGAVIEWDTGELTVVRPNGASSATNIGGIKKDGTTFLMPIYEGRLHNKVVRVYLPDDPQWPLKTKLFLTTP